MGSGNDKQQIEDIKRWLATVAANPAKLKMYVCLLLFAFGYLGVVSPLGDRLLKAQEKIASAKGSARRASAAAHFVEQRKLYEPKLTGRDDVVYWQKYIMEKLDASGARLVAIDPGEATLKFTWKIVRMQVAVQADHYQSLVDFVDRLEHGEHIVRIEQLAIDEMNDGLQLTCTLHALVKPSLKAASGNQAVTDGEDDEAGDEPESDEDGGAEADDG